MSSINVNRINQSNNFSTRLNKPKIELQYSALKIPATYQSTGNCGELLPIFFREILPGQKVKINRDIGIQFSPFVSNVFHEIQGEVTNWFVPYRLLWDKWEEFITGGVDGMNADIPPTISLLELARQKAGEEGLSTPTGYELLDTLADKFGFPISFTFRATDSDDNIDKPVAFLHRAYNMIYNEWIRIPDIEPDEVQEDNNKVLRGNWQWDYFTRARIFQQRGIVPTIPIAEEAKNIEFSLTHEIEPGQWFMNSMTGKYGWQKEAAGAGQGLFVANVGQEDNYLDVTGRPDAIPSMLVNDTLETNQVGKGEGTEHQLRIMPHRAQIELNDFGVNMNDFLIGLGIMRYQINNAKIESRYGDHLRVRWGVYPEDARLQMPEYLGSEEINVQISPVTQTSAGTGDSTQLGYMAGQAGAGRGGMQCEYEAKEHGVLMSLLIVRPRTVYEGGLNKMWIRKNKFDFATPELSNMPDVAIKKEELFYRPVNSAKEQNEEIFGWQGMYEEYRTETNTITGKLRPSLPKTAQPLTSYTLARFWKTAPKLNKEFIQCNPDMDRIKQYTNEPDFVFWVRNSINTAIPLPLQSEPAELASF